MMVLCITPGRDGTGGQSECAKRKGRRKPTPRVLSSVQGVETDPTTDQGGWGADQTVTSDRILGNGAVIACHWGGRLLQERPNHGGPSRWREISCRSGASRAGGAMPALARWAGTRFRATANRARLARDIRMTARRDERH